MIYFVNVSKITVLTFCLFLATIKCISSGFHLFNTNWPNREFVRVIKYVVLDSLSLSLQIKVGYQGTELTELCIS